MGQTTLLVMVPSHIPQCVEIFNGKNSEIGLLRKIETYMLLNVFWETRIRFGNAP